MNDLGKAIGALPKQAREEHPVVWVDLDTMDVYGTKSNGHREMRIRWGRLLHYREAPNQTPTGGRYISRRITVRRRSDGTLWVGQYRTGADTVKLRPDPRL